MCAKSNNDRKVALLTGITGQDGYYLSEFLLARGYEVHGTSRAPDGADVNPRVMMHRVDLVDPMAFNHIIKKVRPSEVYNLAAQTNVRASFERGEYTAQVNALAVLHLLEAVRRAACAKMYAHWLVRNYREAHGMFACNGVLFSHEGARRSLSVAWKIARGAAALALGQTKPLELGNLDSRRDWGHAADYVEAMWLMLQQDAPSDLVIASGESHSVREFAARALQCAGMRTQWIGAGASECAVDESGRVLVRVNPELYRKADMTVSLSDPSEARRRLGWRARVGFDALVQGLVDAAREWLQRHPDQIDAE